MKLIALLFLLLTPLATANAESPPAAPPTKNNYLQLLAAERVNIADPLECLANNFGDASPACQAEDNLIQGLVALVIADDPAAAQKHLAAYVQYRPEKPWAQHYLGRAAAEAQDYSTALRHLRQAEKLNYLDKENYYYLGKSYHAQGDCPQAVENFEQALALNYYAPKIFAPLGDCAAAQRDFPAALDYYTQALGADRQEHQLLWKRAAVHFHQHNYAAALKDITAAQAQAGDNRYAALERFYTRKLLLLEHQGIIITLLGLGVLGLLYRLRSRAAMAAWLTYRGHITKQTFALNYATALAMKMLCLLVLEIHAEPPFLYLITGLDIFLLYVILANVAKRLSTLNIDVRFAILALVPVVNIIQFGYLLWTEKRPDVS